MPIIPMNVAQMFTTVAFLMGFAALVFWWCGHAERLRHDQARLALDREKFDFDRKKFNCEYALKQCQIGRWPAGDELPPGV